MRAHCDRGRETVMALNAVRGNLGRVSTGVLLLPLLLPLLLLSVLVVLLLLRRRRWVSDVLGRVRAGFWLVSDAF